MPEALATSKRKFYKFLDNLSAPPKASPNKDTISTSRSSIISAAEPSTKRIRPSTSSTSLAYSYTRNASSTSLASVRSAAKLAATPRETPNFSPWSHETFLKRLHTFSPVTLWHPKPDAVNEVEWAKRGWSCVETNTVGCKGGCGKRLMIKLESSTRRFRDQEEDSEAQDGEDADKEDEEEDFDDTFEAALVAKYRDLIVEGHSESCLWRQAGCKSDIYRLPIVRSAVWQSELRDRFNSLLRMAQDILNAQIKPLEAMPTPEKLLAILPQALLTEPDKDKENTIDGEAAAKSLDKPLEHKKAAQARALQIALCGWHGTTEFSTALLCCHACFQRLGLWMYQTDYKRPGQATTNTDDEFGDENEDSSFLNLVEMHREHCPWRSSTSQCATGDYAGLPAWRIMWTIVTRYSEDQRRRSKDRYSLAPANDGADGAADEETITADNAGEVELDDHVPDLSQEEIQRIDKERITKLRRLKQAFGFKRKAPAA